MKFDRRPCRFVDERLAPYSRCVQQWSYVYAMGRLMGLRNDKVHLDHVRIPTGCKCQLSANAVATIQQEEQQEERR